MKCPDCGLTLIPSEVEEHWKQCSRPSPDVLNHRIRAGLVPFALPISPSSLSEYKLCPRRYRFKYVDRLPRPSSEPAERGKRFHAVIASKIDGQPALFRPPEFEDELDWARLMRYADSIAYDVSHLIGTEETLRFTWREGEWTVYAEGRLDLLRIDDANVADVDDWKTGFKVKSSIKDDPDMLFYALCVLRNYSQVTAVRGHQVQIARGAIRHARYTVEKIDRFAAWLRRRAKQIIDDKEFRPKPGDHCRFCDHVDHCDVGSRFLGSALVPAEHALVTPENAVEYGQALSQVTSLADRAKDLLSVYADWNGPVYVDEDRTQAWGHWPRMERSVKDLEAFVAECVAQNVNPLSVLKVDIDELKRRKLYRLLDSLDTSVSTYFGFRRNIKPRNKELTNGDPANASGDV